MEGITLQEHFAGLQDPRIERTKQHQLLAIITIALNAVICGADTWVDVEEFGYANGGDSIISEVPCTPSMQLSCLHSPFGEGMLFLY